MDEMIAFLNAQVDEDDQVAQATRKNEQFVHGTDRWFASHNNAITSMAPHRAVAEVEVKRGIIKEHPVGDLGYCTNCWADRQVLSVEAPCPTLRLLASLYADRPGYKESWRPWARRS